MKRINYLRFIRLAVLVVCFGAVCSLAQGVQAAAQEERVIGEFTIQLLLDGSVQLVDKEGKPVELKSLEKEPLKVSEVQSMTQISFSRMKGSCYFVAFIGGKYTLMKVSDQNCGH
jgi:ATP-dependent protease ClpP protease subunit